MISSDKTLTDPRAEEKKPSVDTTRVRQGGASARGSREATLHASEEKFQRLFETAQDGILLLDARTGDITDTNPYIEKLLGYSRRELAGKKLWEIGPFKDTFTSHEAFRKLQRKGYIRYEDLPLETKDGHRREVEFVSNVYQVRNQKVIQCNVRDTTERARIGHLLKESEERFRKVFDEGPTGMALADQQYHFMQANPTFCRLLGYTERELKKLTFKDITHPEDRESSVKNVRELEKGSLSVYKTEKRYITKNKDVIWGALTLSTILDQEGELEFFLVMIEDINDRKQAEEALLASEDKFKYVFDYSVVGKSITLPSGETQVNKSFCEMLDYSPEELQSKSWQDITHADDIELTRRELDAVLSGEKEAARFNKRYLKKDGSVVWADASTSLRRDRQGQPLYFLTSIVDITERKQAEEKVLASEVRYRRLFEAARDGILILDAKTGVIEDVNPFLLEMLGFSLEELRGEKIWELGFFKDIAANKAKFLKLQQEEIVRYENLPLETADGRQFDVEFVSNVYQVDGRKVIQCNIRDITERKQAVDALRANEERFRSIFENAGVGIYRTTPAGQVLMANSVMVSMLGYPSFEKLTRRNLESESFEPGYPRNRFRELIEKYGEVRNLESAWKRGDGKVLYVRESAKAFRNPDGTVKYYEGTADDITDRKQAEEALRASEQRYRSLFEDSPISLWEEDFSAVKPLVEDLSKQGIEDFRAYFKSHPEQVMDCMKQIKVVDVNQAGLKLIGAKSKGEIPSNLSILIPDEAHEDFQEELINIAEGKSIFEWQSINLTLAGERRVVDMRWSAAPGHEDTLDKILLSMIDVTERKQAEEDLARQSEALRLSNQELDRLYRAFGSLLSSTPFDIQSLATTIVDIVLKEFGQANCSLIIVQEDSNELIRLAVAGPYADQVKNKKLTLDDPGLVPQAINTGVVINANDIHSIPGFTPNWDAAQSELTIPLKVGNNVIGVIDIQSSEPGVFKPDDERLMSTFAERAALALEHARLYAQTEQRMRNLNSLRTIDIAISSSMDINLTMGILVEQVIHTLEVHAADVLIFNPVTQSFRYSTGQGFRTQALQHTDLRMGDGYAGRAARERKVVIIQDLAGNSGGLQRSAELSREGFVSYVGVPLIAKGQVKGVLEIFQRTPLELNREQRGFLDMLAGQAAIAIDSARLFEDLQSSNSELMMAYDETIEGWSRAMDLRDKETEGHTQRVTEMTLRLANSMGFGSEELVHIRRGTLLHDIGKMGVPDDILRKPGPLTDEEWVVMRKHPQLAYDMLAPIMYLRSSTDIPYCHHEKWDGTGYPRGLKGEQIPLAARIFAVVDVWDALTSDRPYRKAWPEDEVRAYIQEQAGKHFDPHIVDIFLKEVSSVE